MIDVLKEYWKYSRNYKLYMFFIIIFHIFGYVIDVISPIFVKNILDIVSTNDLTKLPHIYNILSIISFLFFVRWLFYRLGHVLINIFLSKIMPQLSISIFNKIHKKSYKFFYDHLSGAITKKLINFVDSYEFILKTIIFDFLYYFIQILGLIIVLYFINYVFIFIILFFIIVISVLNIYFGKYKYDYDKERNKIYSEIVGYYNDTILNNLNIKLFNRFDFELNYLSSLMENFKKIFLKTYNMEEFFDSIIFGLIIAIELIALYIYIYLWRLGLVTVGDFVLLQLYLFVSIRITRTIGSTIRNFYRVISASYEAVEILKKGDEIKEIKNAKSLIVKNGIIEFKNAYFKYNDEYIFKNLNLKINSKEHVAIVGSSGVGKSTFIKLLLRLFNLNKGKIYIDNQDISKVRLSSLWDNISVVPQDIVLFHRTIKENIKYGKIDATDEEIYNAAKLAYIHDFIVSLKNGYNTYVGERGIKLSGGERQRIAIARAILKNAPILILDEATSSLDSYSESIIQKAIDNLIKDKTVIIIAHRLSTIKKVDRIIVFESGKIVQEGKHDDLIKDENGVYKKLWDLQSEKFIM